MIDHENDLPEPMLSFLLDAADMFHEMGQFMLVSLAVLGIGGILVAVFGS